MKIKVRFFILTALILFAFGCKKENSLSESSNKLEANSKIIFYFRGTINGTYTDWTVPDYKNGDNLNFRFNSGSGVDTLGGDCVNTFCKYMIEDVVIFQNNGAGATKNYIAAGFNISSKTGDRNEIINQFSIGQKTFGKPRFKITDPVNDGAYVYYIDDNGKEWCTHFGPGIQTNSIFKSEQLLNQPFGEISCLNIWKATFSCKLYDRMGNSISLDNCEFFTPVLVTR